MGLFDCPHGRAQGSCRDCDLIDAQNRTTAALVEQTRTNERLAAEAAARDADARREDHARQESLAREARVAASEQARKDARHRVELADQARRDLENDRQAALDAERDERRFAEHLAQLEVEEAATAAREAAEDAAVGDEAVAGAREAAAAEGRTLTDAEEATERDRAVHELFMARHAARNAEIDARRAQDAAEWAEHQAVRDAERAVRDAERLAREQRAQMVRAGAQNLVTSSMPKPYDARPADPVTAHRKQTRFLSGVALVAGLWAWSVQWTPWSLVVLVVAGTVWAVTARRKRAAAGRAGGTVAFLAVLLGCSVPLTWATLVRDDAVAFGLGLHVIAVALGVVALRRRP